MHHPFAKRRSARDLMQQALWISWTIWLCLGAFGEWSHAGGADDNNGLVTSTQPRFMPVDIFIDPHGEPLAAYQLELVDRNESISIVGVEGGDPPAFASPPYYDPKAIRQHKIILAAFSTARNLPESNSRVTTLHVMQKGEVDPDLRVRLTAAATPTRKRVDATATFTLGPAK
jgi:hypothetical protein